MGAIKSGLHIGSVSFSSRLIQGPLAGFSCSAMRLLPWSWPGLAYTCSEMLSTYGLANDLNSSPRYTHIDKHEGPVAFQLAAKDDSWISAAVEKAYELGASLIDINAGCPKPKVRKRGQGSALLANEKKIISILKAAKLVGPRPVTLKIRVDGDSADDFNQAMLAAAHAGGADALIIHGRHWKDDYDVPARWDEIASFKQKSEIPVIGNGDLSDVNSLRDFFLQTQCDGAMISRAAMGQPWIFQQLSVELEGGVFSMPTLQQQRDCIDTHVKGLMELDGEHVALLQCRKALSYYGRGMSWHASWRKDLLSVSVYDDVIRLLDIYFK